MMGDGDSERSRVLNDHTVIGAYLVLIVATVYHAVVLLPAYREFDLHPDLILAASVVIVVWSVLGILTRLNWATTWGWCRDSDGVNSSGPVE